eukprot:1845164-Alexandrium_andersonii.AAC.1
MLRGCCLNSSWSSGELTSELLGVVGEVLRTAFSWRGIREGWVVLQLRAAASHARFRVASN